MPRLLIFDGECGLCHWAISFIYKRLDKKENSLLFVSSTSEAGEYLIRKNGLDPSKLESVIVIDDKEVLLRSKAISKALQSCLSWWPLIGRLILFIPFKDFFYDRIAANRQRIAKIRSCELLPGFGEFSVTTKEEISSFV